MKDDKTNTVEKQVEEFNFILAITQRIKEKKAEGADIEKDIENGHKYIQQKTGELNAVIGAINELQKLIELSDGFGSAGFGSAGFGSAGFGSAQPPETPKTK